ncbi:hypothetical protein CYMTET_28763 [Cymbomonas tetramitiformis]|uniref:Uncharacterized protein n=1 Tax=Cymbomonas tetramitiformis TaxID=36881 RepID=A0AAE0FML0_9CHLO|nr:hypothetical protein CYMTET_28763 [Cymbomonas tetramitiformis]
MGGAEHAGLAKQRALAATEESKTLQIELKVAREEKERIKGEAAAREMEMEMEMESLSNSIAQMRDQAAKDTEDAILQITNDNNSHSHTLVTMTKEVESKKWTGVISKGSRDMLQLKAQMSEMQEARARQVTSSTDKAGGLRLRPDSCLVLQDTKRLPNFDTLEGAGAVGTQLVACEHDIKEANAAAREARDKLSVLQQEHTRLLESTKPMALEKRRAELQVAEMQKTVTQLQAKFEREQRCLQEQQQRPTPVASPAHQDQASAAIQNMQRAHERQVELAAAKQGALEKALREAEEEKVQLNSQLAAQVEKVAALNASIVELKIEAAQGQVVSDSLKNVAHQLIAGPDLAELRWWAVLDATVQATACAEVASLAEYRSELEMKPAELTMRLRAKIGDMQVRLQVEEHTNVRLKAQITRMNARAAADTEAKIDGPNLELTQEVQRLERTRLAEEITRLEKKLVEEAAARSTLQTELDHARDRLLEMHAAQARAEEAKARRENEEREEKETLQQQLASVTKSAEDSESVLSLINPCGTKDGTHDHMVAFWNRLSETGEAIDPGEARAMRDQMERYEQVNQLYRQQLDGMQQEAAATAQRFDMERAVFIELVNSARAQVAALQVVHCVPLSAACVVLLRFMLECRLQVVLLRSGAECPRWFIAAGAECRLQVV